MLERRFAPAHLRAVRAVHFSSSPGTLVSYAATYHTLSSNLGGFKEKIAPGAFDRSIRAGDDVRALINHSPDLIVGRTKNRTLRLSSDAKGLHTECDLPDTSYARDLWTNVTSGLISECSFGFTVEDDSWADELDPEDGRSIKVRTLRSVRLADCSYVTYPAYPGTSVSANPTAEPVRSHSFEQLFPQGVPAEIRSHVGDVRQVMERASERRRRLVNSVLGI